MNVNGKAVDPPDLGPYLRNVDLFPQEELLKYVGQHVAFSVDGTRLVAFGADLGELFKKLDAAGVPADSVILDYVDDPNVAIF